MYIICKTRVSDDEHRKPDQDLGHVPRPDCDVAPAVVIIFHHHACQARQNWSAALARKLLNGVGWSPERNRENEKREKRESGGDARNVLPPIMVR